MRLSSIGVGVLMLAIASSAQAQTNGAWRVNGAIAGRNFVLDCRFEGAGGVCTDAEAGGKRSHKLKSFTMTGDRVAFSFDTKVMLMSIALNFVGRVAGDRMNGTMSAAGRNGTFTGQRH